MNMEAKYHKPGKKYVFYMNGERNIDPYTDSWPPERGWNKGDKTVLPLITNEIVEAPTMAEMDRRYLAAVGEERFNMNSYEYQLHLHSWFKFHPTSTQRILNNQ